jgi:SAM-dependent methyltransferase
MLESAANQWDAIFHRAGRTFLEPASAVTQFAEQLVAKRFRRVLDVGCGSGRHVVCMSDFGLEVYGMDYSPAGLRLASEWLAGSGQSQRLILADMRCAFPFPTAFFDALIATQVIHHAQLAIVRETAREIARVVRPGGFILVSVPVRTDDGEFQEIEPRTYLPLTGSEKGLPHHIFLPEELPDLFSYFDTQDVSVRGDVVAIYQGLRL